MGKNKNPLDATPVKVSGKAWGLLTIVFILINSCFLYAYRMFGAEIRYNVDLNSIKSEDMGVDAVAALYAESLKTDLEVFKNVRRMGGRFVVMKSKRLSLATVCWDNRITMDDKEKKIKDLSQGLGKLPFANHCLDMDYIMISNFRIEEHNEGTTVLTFNSMPIYEYHESSPLNYDFSWVKQVNPTRHQITLLRHELMGVGGGELDATIVSTKPSDPTYYNVSNDIIRGTKFHDLYHYLEGNIYTYTHSFQLVLNVITLGFSGQKYRDCSTRIDIVYFIHYFLIFICYSAVTILKSKSSEKFI